MNEIFEEVVLAIEEGLYSVINRPDVVLLNIVALVILILIIRKFFWSKVTAFLEARQQALSEALDTAEMERNTARELQEKSVKDYEAMKDETRQLKEKLTLEAYQEQEKLITNAKKEASRRLAQAEKDIEFEIAQANQDIKQSIKEIAFAAAEKIVKREIDESVHQDIIDELTQESIK
ncbi:MAG: ATP synthase F0 subunit B [Tenericutes bacterium GWE2_38_8]|nr:MAG: ATP synthase F0 subunit B [Tenericutes bacterium GWE2_38_8]